MKNKIIISTISLFAILTIWAFVSTKQDAESQSFSNQSKIKIAVCPTCFEMTKNLDNEKYEIIPTSSTAQSIELLQNNQVDIILSGRTLKPNEPKLDSLIIKNGYSFLNKNEILIYIRDLNNYNIYTDLDTELLKKEFLIQNIYKVDDIYQYLDKGITITSWENTDYSRAEIVHLMEDDVKRVMLSRQPTIFCPHNCKEYAMSIAESLK